MSRTDVSKFYNEIIDNVISNVKEEFENEGVDEQILEELKQIWKTKLVQSRALESHGPQYQTAASTAINQVANRNYLKPDIGTAGKRVDLPHAQPVLSGPAEMASIAIQNVPHINLPTELTQQSIALPQAAAGTQQPIYRCYQVGDQLVYAVQQPTMQQVQAAVLQQQQQQQLQQQQQQRQQLSGPATQATSALQQIQVQSQSQPSSVLQVDGGNDSSSDDDDFGDDDEDDDDGAKEDDEGDEDGEENQGAGVQEEPLNSDDDESGDELEEDIFDTDNVIVCQYEKINRTRNRWKFHLKDGIMNLDGKDWVFHRGIGEADW